jgi:hypothetical protein
VQKTPVIRRGVMTVVGLIALAVLPVLALNSLATADTGAGSYGSGPAGNGGVTSRPTPAFADIPPPCPGGQSPPGCGSPTSNHHRASCSMSRTVAPSSSVTGPGCRWARTRASDR